MSGEWADDVDTAPPPPRNVPDSRQRAQDNNAMPEQVEREIGITAASGGEHGAEFRPEPEAPLQLRGKTVGVSSELSDFLTTTGTTMRGVDAASTAQRLGIVLNAAVASAADQKRHGKKFLHLKDVASLFDEDGALSEKAEDLIFADIRMTDSVILDALGFKQQGLLKEMPTLRSVLPMAPYAQRAKAVAERAGSDFESAGETILASAVFEFILMNVTSKHLPARLLAELASQIPHDWMNEERMQKMHVMVACHLSTAQIRCMEHISRSKVCVQERASGADMASAIIHALNAVTTKNLARSAAANRIATASMSHLGHPGPDVYIDSVPTEGTDAGQETSTLRTAASVLKGLGTDIDKLLSEIEGNLKKGRKVPTLAGEQADCLISFKKSMSSLIMAMHSGASVTDARTQLAVGLTDLFCVSMSQEAVAKAVVILEAMHDAGISVAGMQPRLLLPVTNLGLILDMLESSPEEEAAATVAGLKAQLALERAALDDHFRKRLLKMLSAAMGRQQTEGQDDEAALEKVVQASLDELLKTAGFKKYAELLGRAVGEMRAMLEDGQWKEFQMKIAAACEAAGIVVPPEIMKGIMRECQIGYSFIRPETILPSTGLRHRCAVIDAIRASPLLDGPAQDAEIRNLYLEEPSVVEGQSISDLYKKLDDEYFESSVHAARKMAAAIESLSGKVAGTVAMTAGVAVMVQEQFTRYSLQIGKSFQDFSHLFSLIHALACQVTIRVPPCVGESRGCTIYVSALADLPRDALYAIIVPEGTADIAAASLVSHLIGLGMGHLVTLKLGSVLHHEAAVNQLRILGEKALACLDGPSTIPALKPVMDEIFGIIELKAHNAAVSLTSLGKSEMLSVIIGEVPGVRRGEDAISYMQTVTSKDMQRLECSRSYHKLAKYRISPGGYMLNEQQQPVGILRAVLVSEAGSPTGADVVSYYLLLSGPPVPSVLVSRHKDHLYVNLADHGYNTWTAWLNILEKETLYRTGNTIVQGVSACHRLSTLTHLGVIAAKNYRRIECSPYSIELSLNPIVEELRNSRIEFEPCYTDAYALSPVAQTSISVQGITVLRPPATHANLPVVPSVSLNGEPLILQMTLNLNKFPDQIFDCMCTMFAGMVDPRTVTSRFWQALSRTCARTFRNEASEIQPPVALHGRDRKCPSAEVLYIAGLPVLSAENPSFEPSHKLTINAARGGVPVNLMIAYLTRVLGLCVTVAASGRSLVLVCSHIPTALAASSDVNCRFFSGFRLTKKPGKAAGFGGEPREDADRGQDGTGAAPAPDRDGGNQGAAGGPDEGDFPEEGDAQEPGHEEEEPDAEPEQEAPPAEAEGGDGLSKGEVYTVEVQTKKVRLAAAKETMRLGRYSLRPIRYNHPGSSNNTIATVEDFSHEDAKLPVNREEMVSFIVNLGKITEAGSHVREYGLRMQKREERLREALDDTGLSVSGALAAIEDANAIASMISHANRTVPMGKAGAGSLAQTLRRMGPGSKNIQTLDARIQQAVTNGNERSNKSGAASEASRAYSRAKKAAAAHKEKEQEEEASSSSRAPPVFNSTFSIDLGRAMQDAIRKTCRVRWNPDCETVSDFDQVLKEMAGSDRTSVVRAGVAAFLSGLISLLHNFPNETDIMDNFPTIGKFWEKLIDQIEEKQNEAGTSTDTYPGLDSYVSLGKTGPQVVADLAARAERQRVPMPTQPEQEEGKDEMEEEDEDDDDDSYNEPEEGAEDDLI